MTSFANQMAGTAVGLGALGLALSAVPKKKKKKGKKGSLLGTTTGLLVGIPMIGAAADMAAGIK